MPLILVLIFLRMGHRRNCQMQDGDIRASDDLCLTDHSDNPKSFGALLIHREPQL